MPDPARPVIASWVKYLAKVIGEPNTQTILLGHSIGCQAILRYLSTLQPGLKIRGVILVAPWVQLTEASYEAPEDREIAQPWIETPIDWEAVRNHIPEGKATAIFSDNDPFVPLSNANVFKKELRAKVLVEHSLYHINTEAGIKELQPALDEIISMSGSE